MQQSRLHEEPSSTPAAEQSSQPGEQSTIRGSQSRSDDLSAKHGNLVAEHDDLDRQLVAVSPAQAHQLEDLDEGQAEEREGHGPVSSSRAIPRKSCSKCPDDNLGTHTVRVAVGFDKHLH
jgi:hypothetical protein